MTNNLRKEIRMPHNAPSIIGVTRRRNAVEIDLTKGFAARRQDIKELLEKFDVADARPMVNEILEEITAEREERQKRKEKQNVENEAKRAAEDTPLNRFIHALKLKNHSLEHLDQWLNSHTSEQRASAFAEFKTLAARRGLALSEEDINFGINFLAANIKTETTPSLLSRIKSTIGGQ